MASVLKESGSIGRYWLEPVSRRVVPRELVVTDLAGREVERLPYSENAALEVCATAGRRHGLLIDFGREVGGRAHLAFGPGRLSRVGVQAVESVEHVVPPMVAGAVSIADKTISAETVRPSGGRPVTLRHFGGFRYLWLYPERPGSRVLREVWLDYTPYATFDPDSCGYFLCSDDLLNRVWFAGLHTLEMCTIHPSLGGYDSGSRIGAGDWVLIDGAKRDRLIWTGDLGPMGAAVYSSNFNTEAVRDSLLSLVAGQEKSGYIPACSPGPVVGRIARSFFGEYVAWWVVCIYQYYLHTGDAQTVREQFPAIKRALSYLHSQCRGGLFRQTPLNMMEWCFTVLRKGRPSYTNLMYYWALNCASFLAHEFDEEDVSMGYVSRAFRLGESIEKVLFDEGRGTFVDTTADRTRVPEDANSIAIVSGLIVEPSRARAMLDYMKETMWVEWGSTNVDLPYYRLTPGLQPHNKRVVPFMNNYEALARFTAGDEDGAMELIRRCWGNMVLREPNTTFWEWAGRDGGVDNHLTSLCHGWSAGVVPLLTKNVLGVRPVAPGYKRFRFRPRPCGLEWFEGRVPTPEGFIEVRVERNAEGEYESRVSAPKGALRV